MRIAAGLTVALAWLGAGPAQAQAPSFAAAVDRDVVALGETFVYEVTLTFGRGRVEDYQPPEMKDLRIIAQTPRPSSQMQMTWSGGQSLVQNTYTWRYELQPTRKGKVVIGPARVRLDGREIKTGGVTISVGAGTAPPMAPMATPADPASRSRDSFLRVAPDKTKVYVGEQVTVGWLLYITQRMDKYQTSGEPSTDGFWTEDLPIPNLRQGLTFTPENVGGRAYEVAPVLRKALFPLQAGQQSIGAMTAEISQVDFFGSTLRNQALRSDPMTIDVLPLPTAGRPRGFDAANVGRFTIGTSVDRAAVAVGEAVTIKVEIRGQGNVRNVRPPSLPHLDGWKSYEPRVTVALDPGEAISGTKVLEILLLPERPGVSTMPALELAFFDPERAAYAVEKSAPITLTVTGEAAAAATVGPTKGTAAENVLPAEIRPIRARGGLRRDTGATLYRSPMFVGVVAVPPLCLALTVLVGRVRERLSEDSARSRRRRLRRLVHQRLSAAEEHRVAGRVVPFLMEIDRVLRDSLTVRLGQPVAGLRMDELTELLVARSLPADLAGRIGAELEACDQGRFAPGSIGGEALGATLERAGELILLLDKAGLKEGASQ